MGRPSFVTVVVCTRELLREGLGRILGAADFDVAAAAASLDDVTSGLLAEDRPILLILDVTSDQSAIITQVRLFRERHPTARIALLADYDQLSNSNVVAAFRFGADAYFVKPNCDTFLKSLELVMLGETILPSAILSFFLDRYDEAVESDDEKSADVQRGSLTDDQASNTYSPQLSAREQSILRYLIEGYSNKTIARKNDIAEATVKVHVKAILRKIRVNNRTQAAIWGMNHDSFSGRHREATRRPFLSSPMSPVENNVSRAD